MFYPSCGSIFKARSLHKAREFQYQTASFRGCYTVCCGDVELVEVAFWWIDTNHVYLFGDTENHRVLLLVTFPCRIEPATFSPWSSTLPARPALPVPPSILELAAQPQLPLPSPPLISATTLPPFRAARALPVPGRVAIGVVLDAGAVEARRR